MKSALQLIQVIQVILTPLRQRFLATIKVVQFSALAVQVVPAQAGRSPARACPQSFSEGQALRSVVLSMGRSYACSVEVRMKGDNDDLQVAYRGRFYRRIAIRPHIRAEGSVPPVPPHHPRIVCC